MHTLALRLYGKNDLRLEKFDLPVNIHADREQLKDALRKDKKRYGARVKFVLLTEIGASVIKDVSLQELEGVIDDLCVSC
jgi:3-dehydroquinate synthetase